LDLLHCVPGSGTKNKDAGLTSRSACLALLIAGLCASAAGQTRPGASAFATSPFDVAAQSVPAGFKGHNCSAIAARTKSAAAQKSEFETRADYEARTARASGTIVMPGLGISDVLAFVLDDPLMVDMRYNAENSEASFHVSEISLLAMGMSTAGLGAYNSYRVQSLNETRRPYVATNAFGARVRAEEVMRNVCSVAVTNHRAGELALHSHAEAKLSGSAAKAAKENLAVLFVVRLVVPFYTTASTVRSATISSPTSLYVGGPSLPVELLDVWYFNNASGEVVAKAEQYRAARDAHSRNLPLIQVNPVDPPAKD